MNSYRGGTVIGDLIKARRQALRLTQVQLGERTGLTQDYISNLERGSIDMPQRGTLQVLGQALSISQPEFFQAAGIMDAADMAAPVPPAPIQLPLTDPDEQFDPAAIASYASVADELTRDGIPPPGTRRSPGQWGTNSGHWWPATVSTIVRRATWLATQPEPWPSRWLAALGRARQPRVRSTHPAHMLTGLMRCKCGGLLTYGARSLYGRYAQCSSRRVRPSGGGCPYPHSYAEVYEEQVAAQLLALPAGDRWIIAAGTPPDLAAWQRLAEDRRKLREAYKHGLYDDAELAAEVAALNARQEALPRASGSPSELRALFDGIRPVFPTLPGPAQNTFLRSILVEVAIDHRKARAIWLPEIARACGLVVENEAQ